MAIRFERFSADPRFGRVYRRVTAEPSWVWRTALAVGVIVFVLPIVLLALGAVVSVVAVYFLLSLLNRAARAIGRTFGGPDASGRRNVRVVDPDERA